ncbi:hypothetical protein CEY16_07770 [Halalkalibacillus sediminis]|uniref:Alpha-D-phosphohexomutase C-terminal domain-containing protein n=1 Tax=Halalkalibacillus sediminis TaxID=2018042 RepID=A0A2I0QU31_9BACI|nr:hypothetical protein CEY16_07770 [Halalkalibacillus sediminis]
MDIPKANVMEFNEDCWCCLRPSGTEPKIKFYIGVKGADKKEAENRLISLKSCLLQRIDNILN